MADEYGRGMAFRDFLANKLLPFAATVGHPLDTFAHASAASGAADAPAASSFLGGLFGAGHNSITVPLPPARPVQARPVAPAATNRQASPQQAAAAQQQGPHGGPMGSPSFEQMLTAYSKANGGISLGEMGALADIAAKTGNYHQRPPSGADIAAAKALANAEDMAKNQIAAAQKAGDRNAAWKAYETLQDHYERIAKASAPDPLQYYGGAQQ